jgi:quercetin dioxygenase-like cupin family protein
MRFLTGKQISTLAVVMMLFLGAVSLNSATQNAFAQVATTAPTTAGAASNPNKVTCPDTTKQVVTPTATATGVTPTATSTAADPVIMASSRLNKQTVQGEFNVLHSILDFDPGITSVPYFFQGPVNLIVIQGNIAYCSGALQRVLIPGDTWTIPAQARFTLANGGPDMARLSLVALEPQVTPTPTGSVSPTIVQTVTGTEMTATPTPSPAATQTGTVAATVTGTAFLGVRAVAADNTGVRVTGLLPNSPAGAAGVQVNDIIIAVNGQAVASLLPPAALTATPDPNATQPIVTAFFQLIAQHKPGDTLQLAIQRGDQTLTINVTLGVLPS